MTISWNRSDIYRWWDHPIIYSQTLLYPPQRSCRGVYWLHYVCPSVCRQILCRTITWVVFLRILKFYQLFTGEERRIPFIFVDFHFCCSSVIGLDMTENRMFTLCHMITWVVFLRMFWNFTSSLPVKRRGSLSFLMIFTFIVLELGALYFIQCHEKILVMYDGIWWNFTK